MNEDEQALFSALTDKQRDVLDILILHKTSKEISRHLGVSPHTVDQRIEAAKRRLGAATRGELAQRYRYLVSVCQRMTYEESLVDASAIPLDGTVRSDPERLLIQIEQPSNEVLSRNQFEEPLRVLPELFKGHWGKLYRLAVIAAIAAMLVFSTLGGIMVFIMLSNLLRR